MRAVAVNTDRAECKYELMGYRTGGGGRFRNNGDTAVGAVYWRILIPLGLWRPLLSILYFLGGDATVDKVASQILIYAKLHDL